MYIYNICKYEYIPTESFDISKVDKVITFEFTEGEKEGLSFCLGKDLEGVNFNYLSSNIFLQDKPNALKKS